MDETRRLAYLILFTEATQSVVWEWAVNPRPGEPIGTFRQKADHE